jgi:hypothetical protein
MEPDDATSWHWQENVTGSGNLTRFTIDNTNSLVQVRDGYKLRISDTNDTNYAELYHDSTDFNTVFTTTTDWNINGHTGKVVIGTANAGNMLELQDTGDSGTSSAPYMSFTDSAGTRQGYIGYGSSGNGNLYLNNDSHGGDIIFNAENLSGTGIELAAFHPDGSEFIFNDGAGSQPLIISHAKGDGNSSDGWIDVAEKVSGSGRGGCLIYVSGTGGNGAPDSLLAYIPATYSGGAPPIHIIGRDAGSMTDIRTGYDSATTNKYVQIQTGQASDMTFSIKVFGFNASGNTWKATFDTTASTTTDVNVVALDTDALMWGVFPQDNGTPDAFLQLSTNNSIGFMVGYPASQQTDFMHMFHNGTNFYTRFQGTNNWFIDGNDVLGTGYISVGKDETTMTNAGALIWRGGFIGITRASNSMLWVNRLTNDGDLIVFQQAGSTEGSISVSGTTINYNGAHLSFQSHEIGPARNARNPHLTRGTVLEYDTEKAQWWVEEYEELDDTVAGEYIDPENKGLGRKPDEERWGTRHVKIDKPQGRGKPGARIKPKDNEQVMTTKISDTAGSKKVAGVFVDWVESDEEAETPTSQALEADYYVGTTGDFVVRVTGPCEQGDLLESNGDGTARVQADDIIRSSTVAKAVQSFPGIAAGVENPELVPCQLLNG